MTHARQSWRLRWHLFRRSGRVAWAPPIIPGDLKAPVIWLIVRPGTENAARQLAPLLSKYTLAQTGNLATDAGSIEVADPGQDLAAWRRAIDCLRPRAIVTLGGPVPAALAVSASRADVPVIAAEIQNPTKDIACLLRYDLLDRVCGLVVTDADAVDTLTARGANLKRITTAGPISALREPLTCLEAERAAMAEATAQRLIWMAAALPPSEEAAFISAHRAALRVRHRAMAIVVAAPSRFGEEHTDLAPGATLAFRLRAAGFNVATRADDDEPGPLTEIFVAEDDSEMGLWYRMAAVCYMGGTLTGESPAPRDPFEPAALGSAILHGPRTKPFSSEYSQLDYANAAFSLSDPTELPQAVVLHMEPDRAAVLATNAWAIATGGREACARVARLILQVAA